MRYRIKDDVDLEVLYDFGFKKVQDFYIREYEKPDLKIDYYKRYYIRIRCLPNYAYYKEIWDCADDQLGFTHTNYESVGVDKLIEDLIAAGLVEDTELKKGINMEEKEICYKDIARKIAMAYTNSCSGDFEDKLTELALLQTNDHRLLEHINNIIFVMNKALEEMKDMVCQSEEVSDGN